MGKLCTDEKQCKMLVRQEIHKVTGMPEIAHTRIHRIIHWRLKYIKK